MLWCVIITAQQAFYVLVQLKYQDVIGQSQNNAEINHPNAIHKPKYCGFRPGAMTPSTG